MGHEMLHAFDINGQKFDKYGRQDNWWKPGAKKEFLHRARCVTQYYQNYTLQAASSLLTLSDTAPGHTR